MDLENIFQEITNFSQETHGSSNYYKDNIYLEGSDQKEFAPFKYIQKKVVGLKSEASLFEKGFVCDSYELFHSSDFCSWYEKQFSRELKSSLSKNIHIYSLPDNKTIFDSIEDVYKNYSILREQHILINNENLPVQLGEWYAKCIFGLRQHKSTSQRGFDFYIGDRKTEVKIHWSDFSSPKGLKLRKSLINLSENCILIYMAKNFMIREISFLDSNFIKRKFSGKGHTIFIKDSDISPYFFSNSNKYYNKVLNSTALLKYATPNFALKISEYFQN